MWGFDPARTTTSPRSEVCNPSSTREGTTGMIVPGLWGSRTRYSRLEDGSSFRLRTPTASSKPSHEHHPTSKLVGRHKSNHTSLLVQSCLYHQGIKLLTRQHRVDLITTHHFGVSWAKENSRWSISLDISNKKASFVCFFIDRQGVSIVLWELKPNSTMIHCAFRACLTCS